MATCGRVLVTGFAAIALCGVQAALGETLSAQDKKFMEDTAKGGMREVHMGHLGVEKGMSQDVKAFSQRLINDHTKANEELAALAKQKGVTLPPDDPKTAASMPIAKQSGADFDKAFVKDMVADHQKDIAAFEKEASSGGDPDLKSWASKTLPTLRAHLKEAQSLDK